MPTNERNGNASPSLPPGMYVSMYTKYPWCRWAQWNEKGSVLAEETLCCYKMSTGTGTRVCDLDLSRTHGDLRSFFTLFFKWTCALTMFDDLNVIPSLIILNLNYTLATTPTVAVQFVITFGYNNFTQGPNLRIAKCSVWGTNIKDAGSTKSDFIRNLKKHADSSVTW